MPSVNARNSARIDKLDFPDQRTPLLNNNGNASHSRRHSHASVVSGGFFEHLAEGVQDRERVLFKREVARYVSFVWAIITCLCAGSITAFSLYGPMFQSRLHYSQYQVNVVSIVAELALYLPVPLFGLLVDRRGPAPASLLAAVLFGAGYFLAAFTYRNAWPFPFMVVSFVGIGMGTSCMYLSTVTTCAKNFGRGKHRGFTLAVPIAAFGLSGMWQSQLGDKLITETNPDGSRGNVDVFRYFLFLGGLLLGVGIVASFLLQIIDESHMIDEAVEDLERSGLLGNSGYLPSAEQEYDYGTLSEERRRSATERDTDKHQKLEDKRRKEWLLNGETRRYLSDHNMWWLTAGFFLVSGPGEAFINNLGTIIGTLYPPPSAEHLHVAAQTSPATHVSIVAVSSTIARILSGTLSDLFTASTPPQYTRHRGPTSLSSSVASLDPIPSQTPRRFTISRMTLLLFFSLLFSLGQVLLASGVVQFHAATRFWVVSALIGTGYGACFSLVPIIVSCVWGVENFGTNWGVTAMAPAGGAAVWSAVYAAVYEKGKYSGTGWGDDVGRTDDKCYGLQCYQITFWAMAASTWAALLLWLWAWRGPKGWKRMGVAV